MSGSSRTPSRQRPKPSRPRQALQPAPQAASQPPVHNAALAHTTSTPGKVALRMVFALLGLVVLAWLALLVFSPALLPALLRPGGTDLDRTPTAIPTGAATAGATAGSGAAGTGGRLSFVRTGDGGLKRYLFVVNADGSAQQQVTSDIVVEGTTQWSPDGKRILMQAGVSGVSNVVVLDVGPDNMAGAPLSLTSDIGKDSAFPAWSPDGSRVAFQSKKDGELFQVYVMDADGNNKRRISDGNGFAGLPAWSPDGDSIAYVSGEQQLAGSQRELYVAPLSGGEPRKLTSLKSNLSNPQWSPDSATIAVLQALADRQYNLLLVNAATGEHRTLLQGGVVRDQRYSPSGDEIAYYNVTPNEGSNVYVVRVSDGAIRNLTDGPGDDYQATWSPDGSMLAWSSKPGAGEYRIVAASPDGTGRRTISSGEGDDYQPAWGVRK
jgi:Tol biopolymer transport system component